MSLWEVCGGIIKTFYRASTKRFRFAYFFQRAFWREGIMDFCRKIVAEIKIWSVALIAVAVAVAVAVSGCNPALAVDFRWDFMLGTGGVSNAMIQNAKRESFTIYCAGAGDQRMGLLMKSPALKKGKTRLQIVVDGEAYQFDIESVADGDGFATLHGRMAKTPLGLLSEALQRTKKKSFVIELPATRKAITLSTLDASKYLDGLLDPCM
jgi:hypothetical protein